MRTYWKLITMLEKINGTNFYGVNRNTYKRSFDLEIMYFSFLREKIHI